MIDQENIAAIETHCIVCGAVVPPDRTKHKSTTCSPEHSKQRKALLHKGDPSCKCVVCTQQVSADRAAHRAITCSPEHKILRKRSIRARNDVKRCRYCCRPATPIERAAFRRFRKLEMTRPDLLYPAAWRRWQERGLGDLAAFAVYLRELIDKDDDAAIDSQLGLIDWRYKDAPGGPKSGRPRDEWEGGDQDCNHALPIRRKGGKPIPAARSNRCRKCNALRVGMEPRQPEVQEPQQQAEEVNA